MLLLLAGRPRGGRDGQRLADVVRGVELRDEGEVPRFQTSAKMRATMALFAATDMLQLAVFATVRGDAAAFPRTVLPVFGGVLLSG